MGIGNPSVARAHHPLHFIRQTLDVATRKGGDGKINGMYKEGRGRKWGGVGLWVWSRPHPLVKHATPGGPCPASHQSYAWHRGDREDQPKKVGWTLMGFQLEIRRRGLDDGR